MSPAVGIALIAIGTIGGLAGLLMLWRNELVYRSRVRMIDEDWHRYKTGPSYEQMLHDFRCWTYRQFYPLKEKAQ